MDVQYFQVYAVDVFGSWGSVDGLHSAIISHHAKIPPIARVAQLVSSPLHRRACSPCA